MPYVPHTDNDRLTMLQKIGAADIEQLLASIPAELRLQRPLDIPAHSEMEVLREVEKLSQNNQGGLACFAGGGVYDHFIPAAVGSVISRPEFMTAYTPYQPEVSQGTLQVIYEFQTHICRLTGMDVANASMYDGATAAAEAAVVATRSTRRPNVIVAETVSPLYREVIKTYLSGRDVSLITIPMDDGLCDPDRLQAAVDDRTACLLMSQPNFFGGLEDMAAAAEIIHNVGGKLIVSVDPIAQALLKTPAEYGADIVVGEGQPLGLPLSFGGPLLGFFAARRELVRSLPGRIAGRTTDVDGKTGFVLVLQTREQHIRREKATSNICTNQALCATAASVYMTLLGRSGLKQVALLSAEKAQQAAKALEELEGCRLYFDRPFVREFALRIPVPVRELIRTMVQRRVLPGIAAGRWYPGMADCLIVALTEKRTEQEIGDLVDGLRELTAGGTLSQMQT